jgi:hypothetical protein
VFWPLLRLTRTTQPASVTRDAHLLPVRRGASLDQAITGNGGLLSCGSREPPTVSGVAMATRPSFQRMSLSADENREINIIAHTIANVSVLTASGQFVPII